MKQKKPYIKINLDQENPLKTIAKMGKIPVIIHITSTDVYFVSNSIQTGGQNIMKNIIQRILYAFHT